MKSWVGCSQINKTLTLGTVANFGNLNSFNMNAQAGLAKDTGRITWSVLPTFQYTMIKNKDDYETYEKETFFTSSISRHFGKWKIISFSDAENSYLRKIRFRVSSGIGLGYVLLHNSMFKISISEVIMPEYYLSEPSEEDSVNRENFTLRPSTRFKLKYSHKFTFESISFIQPAIWTSSDIRFKDNINFRTTNTLDAPIGKKISIGFQFIMQIFTLPNYFDDNVRIIDSKLSFIAKLSL
jgi:hypothetical protein